MNFCIFYVFQAYTFMNKVNMQCILRLFQFAVIISNLLTPFNFIHLSIPSRCDNCIDPSLNGSINWYRHAIHYHNKEYVFYNSQRKITFIN